MNTEARLRDIHEAILAGHFNWAIESLRKYQLHPSPRDYNTDERLRLIHEAIDHRYIYGDFYSPSVGYDKVKGDNARWRARYCVESSLVSV